MDGRDLKNNLWLLDLDDVVVGRAEEWHNPNWFWCSAAELDLDRLSVPDYDASGELLRLLENRRALAVFLGPHKQRMDDPMRSLVLYDVILLASDLHHLRDDQDWQAAFEKILSLLKPGGSVCITDLVVQVTIPGYEQWSNYGEYLERLVGN